MVCRENCGIVKRLMERIEELETEMYVDSLTKAHNRKFLDQYSRNDITGIIIVDIDFFKSVNDTYGHLVGDEVLSAVASTLLKNSRKEDLVIRYGGEEFIVLVRHIKKDISVLVNIAERYRKAIEKLKIQVGNNITLRKITISCGVAILDDNDIFPTIKKADDALYHAKNSGRNRVVPSLI